MSAAEQEFLKQRFVKEFEAQNAHGTKEMSIDAELLLADTLKANLRRFESAQNKKSSKESVSPKGIERSQIDVTSIRRRRIRIEEELESLRQSINHKNMCLSMSYKNESAASLHPAMEQSTKLNKPANNI